MNSAAFVRRRRRETLASNVFTVRIDNAKDAAQALIDSLSEHDFATIIPFHEEVPYDVAGKRPND